MSALSIRCKRFLLLNLCLRYYVSAAQYSDIAIDLYSSTSVANIASGEGDLGYGESRMYDCPEVQASHKILLGDGQLQFVFLGDIISIQRASPGDKLTIAEVEVHGYDRRSFF